MTPHAIASPRSNTPSSSSRRRSSWPKAMNIVWAVLIVAVATAAGVAVMLAVRRPLPSEGSYFADGDRAAGIFGVAAASKASYSMAP